MEYNLHYSKSLRNCSDFISSINSNIFLLLLSACILACISCLLRLEAGVPCSFLSVLRGRKLSLKFRSTTILAVLDISLLLNQNSF